MTLDVIGYGAGTMDLSIPNVVRLFVGEASAVAEPELETICQLEATVDDMSPRLWEPVIEDLLEAGALTCISRGRRRLLREMVSLSTFHGTIPFKVSQLDGRAITVTPEFEEVRRIARAEGLPARNVLDAARTEGRPTSRFMR